MSDCQQDVRAMSARCQLIYSCFLRGAFYFCPQKQLYRYEKIETYLSAALQLRVYITRMGATYRQGYCKRFQGTVYNWSLGNG